MNEKIVSALIGLSGAYANNGKTEHTDAVVMKALLNCLEEDKTDSIVDEIRKEKFSISPGCETCPTPCGNTSDYDMHKFYNNKALQQLKLTLLNETVNLVTRIKCANKTFLPEIVYQAISYLGYELVEESYLKLIENIKQMEV